MDMDLERALAAMPQSPLADEMVAMLAAVVSNASALDSATREGARKELAGFPVPGASRCRGCLAGLRRAVCG